MSPPPNKSAPSRQAVVLFLAGVLGLVVVATAIGFAVRATEPSDNGPTAGPYRGSEPPAGIKLPRFELTSYSGTQVASETLGGKATIVTILDAQCTDVCPIIASVVAGAIDRLTPRERREVKALGITGDPAEDTPPAVRQFLAERQALGRLDYLLGSEAELRPLWTALQILPSLDSGQDTLHSAPVRIYDRGGVWVATLHAGVDLSEENLLHDIRTALAADDETKG